MSRFFSIVGLFLLYTAFKAAQLWPAHPWVAGAAVPVFLVMLSPIFLLRSGRPVFERRWFRALAWAGSLTMAVWSTFLLLSLVTDALTLLVTIFHRIEPAVLLAVRRGMLALSAALALAGFGQVMAGPTVRRVRISVAGLPAALRGLTIAHISDLHVGPTVRRGYVAEVVEAMNRLKPDIVALTGDLVDGPVSALAPHLAPLRGAVARFGMFFVPGNHEYYWNAGAVAAAVNQLGFTPLFNDHRRVTVNGADVVVAGITDPMGETVDGQAPDLARADAPGGTRGAALKIFLSHRPAFYAEAEARGFHLQLSGHTHAGQFFPFSLLIGFFHRFSRGLYRHGRLSVYVNPGTGYWGPADRLGVPAEIALMTVE